jgi:hypothetical protein
MLYRVSFLDTVYSVHAGADLAAAGVAVTGGLAFTAGGFAAAGLLPDFEGIISFFPSCSLETSEILFTRMSSSSLILYRREIE